jgi:hypothetical protein
MDWRCGSQGKAPEFQTPVPPKIKQKRRLYPDAVLQVVYYYFVPIYNTLRFL